MNRRRFLGRATANAAFVSAHSIAADQALAAIPGEQRKGSARILALNMLTAAPLAPLKDFYQRLLDLTVVDEAANRLTIAAGETLLTFTAADGIDSQPFYHFALTSPKTRSRRLGVGKRNAAR